MRQSFLPRTLHALVAALFMVTVVMAVDGAGTVPASAEGGSTIHGTVLDSQGLPAVGATVELDPEVYPGAITVGADGQYSFTDVWAGSYHVVVTPSPSSATQDARWRSSEAVEVGFEPTTVQFDVRLPRGAAVTGLVTGGGEPLMAPVTLHDSWGGTWSAASDGSGRYEIAAVPPGSYRLQVGDVASMYSLEWKGEWFDNATEFTATPIVVDEGVTYEVPEIQLDRYAHISGRVTDWRGDPVPYMSVYAVQPPWPDSGIYFWGQTGPDGRYSIVVPPGDYFVYFWADDDLGEFFDNVYSQGEAHIFSVTGAEQFVADAQLRQPTLISGTITSHSQPAPWVNVVLLGAEGWAVRSTSTDEAGRYDLVVPAPGVYTVCVDDWHYINECWDDQPAGAPGTPIDMTSAVSFVADFDLGRAPTVSGRVVDMDGNPVEGLPVEVTNADGFWNAAYTDADGRYQVMGTVGTVDVAVRFGLFWHEPVTVDLVADQDLTDVGITLYRYAVVTGHSTTDPDSWEGHAVHVVGPETDRYDVTDWQGDFTLHLAPGTYTITVEPSESSWLMPASQRVTVDWGDTPTLDFALDAGGRIGGQVTSDLAVDVGEVRVDVISPATLEVVATTSLEGTSYLTPRLAPGAYYVQFRPADGNRHAAEYWDDAASVAGATMVMVRALETTTADAQLHLRGAAAAYTPLTEKRAVELAWASFAQRNPVDACWQTALDVRVVEATTVTPKAKPTSTRYADVTLVATNDCWGIVSTSRSTVSLAGLDASVDRLTGAHLTGATIPIDGAVYFTDFVVDLTWTAAGDVVTVVSHNGQPVPGGTPGTHQVERRVPAAIGGSVTSSPWAVVTFTSADLVDAGISAYTEVITR